MTDDLNKAIDGAEALFKINGITHFATYDTMPLELEVGIISSSGRRYFEALNKLDQLMPLLQTLEIHEVITPRDADIQRAGFKRAIRSVAGTARNLATGLRRRMNEFSAKEAEHERLKAATSDGKMESAEKEASPAGGEELDDGKEQLPVLPQRQLTQRRPPKKSPKKRNRVGKRQHRWLSVKPSKELTISVGRAGHGGEMPPEILPSQKRFRYRAEHCLLWPLNLSRI